MSDEAAGKPDPHRASLSSTLRQILSRPVDRMAILFIAVSATAASFGETIVLIVISLAALRLSSDAATAVDLPFGIPIDELGTPLLLGFGAIILGFRLAALLANSYLAARLAESVLYRWRTRLFSAFQTAPWEMQAAQDEGYLQTITQTYVGRVNTMLQQLASAITAGISFATFVVGAFILSPIAALGLFGFGAALFLALRPLTKVVKGLSTAQSVAAKEYARLLGEASGMSLEHRILGSGKAVAAQLDHQLRLQKAAARRQKTLQAMTPQIYTGIGYFAILGGIAVASQMELADVAVLGAIVLMMIRSLGYGHSFQGTTQAVAASEPFAREMLEIVAELEHRSPRYGPVSKGVVERIELRDVSLGYQAKTVASGIDLRIKSGESIGIIGPSGGGKSTLALTLLGLLPPVKGEYLVNGISSTDFSRDWWQRNLSFVPQQPLLFDGTVAANIAIYRPDLSRSEIEAAARAAHLGGELDEWAEGLDYRVGPRGGRLSGGQRQRICIARALIGRPSVLLLDEPTSALDTSAEDSITDVLRELRHSCTMVVIAHRLSTLAFCDRVLLVVDGSARELGTGLELQDQHDIQELMASTRDQASESRDRP